MKKLVLLLLALTLTGLAGPVLAEKKAKKQILHCGCVVVENTEAEGGDWANAMVYTELDISGNSKGHAWNHVPDSLDECWDGEEGSLQIINDQEVFVPETETFARTKSDCRLGGPNDPLLDDCVVEDGQEAGLSCGVLAES